MKEKQPSKTSGDLQRRVAALTALIMAQGAAHAQSTAGAATADKDAPIVDLPGYQVTEQPGGSMSSIKLPGPLRNVPQTITVIPQQLIQEQGATSLRDILRNSPGITFQAGEGGTPAGDQMTIRGFSARTDMFVDGVRDLGGYARDSFNLEQVEVAKGPSSAVAGRGSTGGSVNLVSKSPQMDAFRRGSIGFGTDNYFRSTLDVNEPLAADGSVAARVNAMVENAGVPGRDVVKNRSWGVAPSVVFGLGKPTQVTASYQRLEQNNVPDYGLPRQAFDYDPPVPTSNFYGLKARDHERIDQDLATVEVTHRVADSFTLRNLTRFGRTYRDSVITAPRFVSGSTDIIRRSDWKSRDQTDDVFANQTNLSGVLESGSIRHELSAGVEFTRETERNYNRVEDPATVLPDTDLYAPNLADPYDGSISRDGSFKQGRGDTMALYVFDTVRLGERWQLTGGLRYDDFDATQTEVDSDGGRTEVGRRDQDVSSRFAAIYKPVPIASIYAGFSNAFNPSAEGLSLTSRRTDLSDVSPEKTRTYEVGTKWDVLDARLSLSAGLFRTEKTNARTPGIDPSDPPTVLEGRQRVEGVELNAAGRLARNWDVFAGLALMDSEIEASNNLAEEGVELGLTPTTSFNLWSSYRLPGGVALGGGAQYMASVFRNATSGESVPSYWLFNAMASYAVNENLSLRLNVMNLTNAAYIDRVGGGHHIPGPARQFILSSNFSF